ncbi:T9SS type A sorting domain-containing protein [Pontibacter qinzhouensis]|uniref:T9SS type A sorting domain-containing protein n=1 Tax=Pontibacter qinzhouensis TaxID=2603253 RepID=A0A5C8ILW0_9BACT|nr:T9SS type A sorting domain-containing protein [Pontibacter qinzhouensis]TXK22049.1 T9SS type A sorting domain-containing protein [Pontibacter qinzhouensis]
MSRLITILFCLLFTCSLCLAQQVPMQFKLCHDVPVTHAAGALEAPWSGGLNSPQFSTIDLNQDGQEDLFAFDRTMQKVYTWLAVQENGVWRYKYAPEYESLFPKELSYWVLLRDYNCDGLKDIFTSAPLGIQVYRQVIGEDNKITFVLAEDALYYSNNNVRRSNMQMGSADIPIITDMDGDGDLDIITTEFSLGETMEYHRNMRVEQGLDCNELRFVQETNWWGGITECDGCNNFVFGGFCRVAAPLHSGHDGSALLAIDLDGDGDKDLLMGNIYCHNLQMMENVGTPTKALMQSLEPSFPLNTRPANFRLFTAPYYEDVTFDGVPDLLVAPNISVNDSLGEMQHAVWLYKNNGAEDHPEFEFVQEDFLQGQMIDLGEGAFPAFADIDGDGKFDLLVGNAASLRNGKYTASLSLYLNTGTNTEPAFTLATDDYLGLAANEYLRIKPAFTDFNNDGVPDLVLTFSRKQLNRTQINYIPNTGGAGKAFQLDVARLQLIRATTDGDSPCFVDVDDDGDLDLLLGKAHGGLEFHRNIGTASAPDFVLETLTLGGIVPDYFRRNIYPLAADLDGNGTPELITVDDSGVLRIYRDFTKELSSTFVEESQVLENALTQKAEMSRFGRATGVAMAGLGGSDKLFLAVGTQAGGMYLLEQTEGLQHNPNEPVEGLGLEVYPNPWNAQRFSVATVRAAEPVAISVYDGIGRVVYKSTSSFSRTHSLDLRTYKAGIYFVRATNAKGDQQVKKLIVQ